MRRCVVKFLSILLMFLVLAVPMQALAVESPSTSYEDQPEEQDDNRDIDDEPVPAADIVTIEDEVAPLAETIEESTEEATDTVTILDEETPLADTFDPSVSPATGDVSIGIFVLVACTGIAVIAMGCNRMRKIKE